MKNHKRKHNWYWTLVVAILVLVGFAMPSTLLAHDHVAPIQLGDSFKLELGNELSEKLFPCEACNKLVKPDVPKCPHCGAEFEEAAPQAEKNDGGDASTTRTKPLDHSFIKKGESGLALGIGLTFAIEEFDSTELGAHYENTAGFYLSLGYQFNNVWSIHARVDVLPGAEGEGDVNLNGNLSTIDGKAEIYTFQLALKIAPDFGLPIRPFVIGGGGVMWADYSQETSGGGNFSKESVQESDPFFEAGAGVELALGKLSIVGSVTYVIGLDHVDAFTFYKISVGAQIRF